MNYHVCYFTLLLSHTLFFPFSWRRHIFILTISVCLFSISILIFFSPDLSISLLTIHFLPFLPYFLLNSYNPKLLFNQLSFLSEGGYTVFYRGSRQNRGHSVATTIFIFLIVPSFLSLFLIFFFGSYYLNLQNHYLITQPIG